MIPTGCKSIDVLLDGGLVESAITQFYGASGAGKTNVAISAAYTAAKTGKRVLFIDTEGSFHEERVKQIFGRERGLLKNVSLIDASNFEEQKNAIASIEKEKADLVIVDSMTSLYRVERNDDNYYDVNRELGKQASLLLAYARKNKVPVLITNQVYTNVDSGFEEPVGGDILKYYSKIIVGLEKNGHARKALLRKHVCKKDGGECSFMIVERGLTDA
ncbi:DNA repair and recombination protein RadB [Candidatus Micrarchaeota archaeon]|nr:DNA repair and recombination protein RadB [Candidatus Micrarchaeota archaeon]